jgi:hypothetical protein
LAITMVYSYHNAKKVVPIVNRTLSFPECANPNTQQQT